MQGYTQVFIKLQQQLRCLPSDVQLKVQCACC
jgi:hypothetical protein